jgi:hypothetical protein
VRLEIQDPLHRDVPIVIGWIVSTPSGYTLEAAAPAPDDPLYSEGGPGWEERVTHSHMARLENLVRWGQPPRPGQLRGRLEAVEVPDVGNYPAALREEWPIEPELPQLPQPDFLIDLGPGGDA